MSLKRYEQLSVYFTLRDLVIILLTPSDEWFAILEPVVTHLRTTCKKLCVTGDDDMPSRLGLVEATTLR